VVAYLVDGGVGAVSVAGAVVRGAVVVVGFAGVWRIASPVVLGPFAAAKSM